MKQLTTIDTVGIRINSHSELFRDDYLYNIKQLIRDNKLFISERSIPKKVNGFFYQKEYPVYRNNVVIASVVTGSYTMKEKISNRVYTVHYIHLVFAGLVRYDEKLDSLTNDTLFKVCAYLNTRRISFILTHLDVCLDLFTDYNNVLALCTKKSPRTVYYGANEAQKYPTTSYIEKVPASEKHDVVQRAYLYDKSVKENLSNNITRFELKLQPKFFRKYQSNIPNAVIRALNKYHVMYIPRKSEKQAVMDLYDAHAVLRQRDIKRIGFNQYRCYPDITAIVGFINKLYAIQQRQPD